MNVISANLNKDLFVFSLWYHYHSVLRLPCMSGNPVETEAPSRPCRYSRPSWATGARGPLRFCKTKYNRLNYVLYDFHNNEFQFYVNWSCWNTSGELIRPYLQAQVSILCHKWYLMQRCWMKFWLWTRGWEVIPEISSSSHQKCTMTPRSGRTY